MTAFPLSLLFFFQFIHYTSSNEKKHRHSADMRFMQRHLRYKLENRTTCIHDARHHFVLVQSREHTNRQH